MRPRPISVTIFGILNIGFALLGLLTLLVSVLLFSGASAAANPILKQMSENPQYAAWTKFATPVNGVASIALLAAGIGLLLLQNWARILSIVHGVYSILFSIAGCIVAIIGGGALFMKVGTAMGCVISLVYPVLLIVFMLRPNVTAAVRPLPPAT